MVHFTGDSAEDVRLAEAAWEAAVGCTGKEAVGAFPIPITRSLPEASPFGGLSHLREGSGMVAIELRADRATWTVAHEVAHAWSGGLDHEHPFATTVEGGAEALATCIAEARPDLFLILPGLLNTLPDLPDLRTWSEAETASMRGGARADAYEASARLYRLLTGVIPARTLWERAPADWGELRALIQAAGPRGEAIVAAMEGGPVTQRSALNDPDSDGVLTLAEGFQATDPTRWDTDGDGWWDGAPVDRPRDAVPLPRGDGAVCLPFLPDAGASTVAIEYGGVMYGVDVRPASAAGLRPDALLRPGPNVLAAAGGVWVRPVEAASTPNPGCALAEGTVIRGAEAAEGALRELAAAIATERRLYRDAGLPLPRSALIERTSGVVPLHLPRANPQPTFTLSEAAWATMASPQGRAVLAGQVVALQSVLAAPPAARFEAAALALYHRRHPELGRSDAWMAVDPAQEKAWGKVMDACPTGDVGVFTGACGGPPAP